jgi:hypothetical protein
MITYWFELLKTEMENKSVEPKPEKQDEMIDFYQITNILI